ncbi:unnamed protein product [Fusarium venenatum]|uniref:Uncharacterized protein n=1 Tax=Fusarium venenatum TaxID=56646 RepID=A0A2L2TU55_9HYPO|nr:uncharacterized protein FVRRES_09234 [Fusarium venenatum]CEI69157.1 unnamed protein product [Fusarium venenatum]
MAIAARHKTALRDYVDAIGCFIDCATLGFRWSSALSLGIHHLHLPTRGDVKGLPRVTGLYQQLPRITLN